MELSVTNHQDVLQVDVEGIAEMARQLLPLCRELPGGEGGELGALDRVEVSLVDDACIAELHERFMGVPGATDVITFHHGEIVVSVETARSQAREHGEETGREILRYIVHGLLHLNGYDDRNEESRGLMMHRQEEILKIGS